jgi:hypothetical protein
MGRGVSACATCDGFFYKGQDVLVVGGGNTAVEEALYLANIAQHVTLVHRRDKFRAEAILDRQADARHADGGNMPRAGNTRLDEVSATRPASRACASATCAATRTQEPRAARRLHRDRPYAQHADLRGPARHGGGYIKVKGGADGIATATSVPGVFAAGDVADHVYRQAVTSAGTGCMAALDAEAFLDDHPIAVPLESDARDRSTSVAKLEDLKALYEAARSTLRAGGEPSPHEPTARASAPRIESAPVAASVKRAIAAAKHAEGDIDLPRPSRTCSGSHPRNKAAHRARRGPRRFRRSASRTSATRWRCRSTARSRARKPGTLARSSRPSMTFVRPRSRQ